MPEFNSMTVTAAAQIIEQMSTQAEFTSLAIQWGVDDRCGSGSVLTKVNAMAAIALRERPSVYTIEGQVPLDRAMIAHALTAPVRQRAGQIWTKMVAGLRLDGFEVCEQALSTGRDSLFGDPTFEIRLVLRRMLPEVVPSMDSRAAQSELSAMLVDHGFTVSKGHLDQAIAAFSRGDWAAANSQLRTLFEDCLNEIASRLGCDPAANTSDRRRFLGEVSPPFLFEDYNEWFANTQRPQYVQGLWSRLHSHGSHPGLSEQDDCTFRMQIALISVRLFLRRFIQRVASSP
jgi:hypothetical protein